MMGILVCPASCRANDARSSCVLPGVHSKVKLAHVGIRHQRLDEAVVVLGRAARLPRAGHAGFGFDLFARTYAQSTLPERRLDALKLVGPGAHHLVRLFIADCVNPFLDPGKEPQDDQHDAGGGGGKSIVPAADPHTQRRRQPDR